MQQTSLKMAAPQGINVLIKTIDDSAAIINDPRASSMNILLLCKSVHDAYEVLTKTENIDRINIANVGRFDGSNIDDKIKINSTIYLDEKDAKGFRAIQNLDIKMVHQISPDSKEQNLKEVNS